MARTIANIAADIRANFMSNATLATSYGFTAGDSFDATFSKVSLESIWTYIVAVSCWAVESLFDTHKSEVNALIDTLKPHSITWYTTIAKAYLFGYSLPDGETEYDTSALTDSEITSAQVVKYAKAMEKQSVVYIKVATDSGGSPAQLTTDQVNGFREYIKEVKDAGVVVQVINEPAEYFGCNLTIYYNPMVLNASGQATDGTYPVLELIKSFIADLPFNGEYRNVSLVDKLQAIDGVVIPELHEARTKASEAAAWNTVNAKAVPYSGYYKVYDDSHLEITYTPYESISN
jgi:hypothetical protein